MHIIIPMSGIGKRFKEAGYTVPKPLIMIENKHIIHHIVNLFPGEHKFTFICNDEHLRTTDMREILTNIVPNCSIYEVSVNNRKGPVDAVLQAQTLIDDNEEIIVSYCDYGTKWDYTAFLNDIRRYDADGSIACYRGFHPHMLGSDNYAFIKETDLFMDAIQEKKPFTENKMDEYASNGTYYFKSGKIVKKYFQELVDKNIHVNNEFYVSMVYQLMREDHLKIRIFEIEKMLQWGTPKDLEEYLVWSNYFLYRNSSFQHTFQDRQNTTLILPMAGAGSRFFSMGYTTPKPLLEVEGIPMVVKAVGDLPHTTHKIFICQNEHLESYDIQRTLLSRYPESQFIGIDYVTEGQACTCELAFKLEKIQSLESPVMISACDNGAYYDMDAYTKLVNDPDVDIIVWSFSNNPTSQLYPHMYAWLDVDENQYIRRVSIKKPFEDCENKYAIIGTMLFKKGTFFLKGLNKIYYDELRTNGEFYVDNMIEPLINMGYKCKILNVDNYLCWGTPNDYKTYEYWFDYFKNNTNIS